MSNISGNFIEKKLINAQRGMVTWIIEATELKFDVRSDLRGCLEVKMASEATKIAVRSSMHMETRVIGATEYNFKIRSDL